MKGIRKGLACLLVGVLTLGATGFVSGSVYAENAPAVQATLTAQATYTGTAQGVSHTIEERENAIGSNVIVRVPVWIEKIGRGGVRYAEVLHARRSACGRRPARRKMEHGFL